MSQSSERLRNMVKKNSHHALVSENNDPNICSILTQHLGHFCEVTEYVKDKATCLRKSELVSLPTNDQVLV